MKLVPVIVWREVAVLLKIVSSQPVIAVLIRLWSGLEAYDVCTRFKISETTYVHYLDFIFVKRVTSSIPISFKTKGSTVDAKVF